MSGNGFSVTQIPNLDSYTDIHHEENQVCEHSDDGEPASEDITQNVSESSEQNQYDSCSWDASPSVGQPTNAQIRTECPEPSYQSEASSNLDVERKDKLIDELRNEVQSLTAKITKYREENQRKDVELLHAQQDHTIAMATKRRELEDLENQLKREEEEHRDTKDKLTEVIMNKNDLEQQYSSMKRNYEACLKDLMETKTERDVLAKDREDHYKEARFYEGEGKKLTEEVHALQQRNADLNKSITMLNNESKLEIQRLELENTSLALKVGILERSLEDTLNGQDTKSGSSLSLMSAPSLDVTSILGESDSEAGQRLAVTRSHDESTGSALSKRFKVTPSLAPYCRNCGLVVHGEQSRLGKCGFHAAPPQPYQVWKDKLNMSIEEHTTIHPDSKYWPCCGKISRNEPPGCKILRQHDLVYPLDHED